MNSLLVAASNHGSTLEIAQAIGEELRQSGHTVAVFEAKAAPEPTGYGATIIVGIRSVGSTGKCGTLYQHFMIPG